MAAKIIAKVTPTGFKKPFIKNQFQVDLTDTCAVIYEKVRFHYKLELAENDTIYCFCNQIAIFPDMTFQDICNRLGKEINNLDIICAKSEVFG